MARCAIPDIIAGVILVVIAALIGFIMLGYMLQLGTVSAACEGIDPDGARCAPAFLGAMQIVGYAIVVFAWAITTGFIVVRIIRRRPVFFLPLVGTSR